jgi:hypothetical protein
VTANQPVGRKAESQKRKEESFMHSKKSLKAKPKNGVKTNLSAAMVKAKAAKEAKAPKKPASKNFLFSIPSLHTANNDYEHLVIAANRDEACRLLAEARVTEKQPTLEGETRQKVVYWQTQNYCGREVKQIEARKEDAGVLMINHQKLGNDSLSLN